MEMCPAKCSFVVYWWGQVMLDTDDFKRGVWYWLANFFRKAMFENGEFKELLIDILLSLIALAGVFAFNFLNTRINHYSDLVKILVFLIVMVIINWNSLIGLLKNYKDLDLVNNNQEKEIEDEFSIFNFTQAAARAFIMSLIMLAIIYYLSIIFPDFISSITKYGVLKVDVLHKSAQREVFVAIIGFAIEIIFAAMIISTNYQNYKYR